MDTPHVHRAVSDSGSSELSEEEAARLLAALLADEDVWGPSGDPESRIREALCLYERTSRTLSAHPREESRLVTASWILRDIADRVAFFSWDWSRNELKSWVFIPDRSVIEDEIRSAKIDEWAAEMGTLIPLDHSSDHVIVRPLKERLRILSKLPRSRREVAKLFLVIANGHRNFLQTRRTEGVAWFASRPRMGRGARGYIASARNVLGRAALSDDEAALVVAQTMLLMAQGMFVASHAPDEVVVFPSEAFVSRYLQDDGRAWLKRHGAPLPPWL